MKICELRSKATILAMQLTLLKIDFPPFRGATLNGCHFHKIVDTISTYFSYDIKAGINISMYNISFFRFE